MPSLLCVLLKCAVVALRGGQGLESLYKVVDQNSYKPVTALTLYNTQPPVRFSVLRNLEVSHLIISLPMDLTVEFLDVTNIELLLINYPSSLFSFHLKSFCGFRCFSFMVGLFH